MEITTSPYRPATTPWGRLVALVVVLGPVSVLVLLPIGLGLDRYVLSGSSMAGGLDRGSVLFERQVPVSDLRVGDVITYRPPASAGVDGMVTHRVVETGRNGIVTKGDALDHRDPWRYRPDGSTVSRVDLALPWIGYAYLVLFRPGPWPVLAVALAVLLLTVVGRRRTRHDAADPGPAPAVAARRALAETCGVGGHAE